LFQLSPDQRRVLGQLRREFCGGDFLLVVPAELSGKLGIVVQGPPDLLAFLFEDFAGGDGLVELVVAGRPGAIGGAEIAVALVDLEAFFLGDDGAAASAAMDVGIGARVALGSIGLGGGFRFGFGAYGLFVMGYGRLGLRGYYALSRWRRLGYCFNAH